jgi:hypothetical protein
MDWFCSGEALPWLLLVSWGVCFGLAEYEPNLTLIVHEASTKILAAS